MHHIKMMEQNFSQSGRISLQSTRRGLLSGLRPDAIWRRPARVVPARNLIETPPQQHHRTRKPPLGIINNCARLYAFMNGFGAEMHIHAMEAGCSDEQV
ncbi:hypothetical protein ACERNI_03670 [Camelimonas sp. ID_303_24]